MEEGSMRVDANVSVRKPGEPYGTRCEIKNVNSIRSIGRAIEYEAKRQIQMLKHGERVRQQTRHWDEVDNRTHTLRDKEEADDYRYFLEPDLVPVAPSPEWIDAVRAELPMLPAARRHRLSEVAGAEATSEAVTSIVERGQDDYALAVVASGGDAGRTVVHLKEAFAELGPMPDLPAADLAGLTRLETSGSITATQAKAVLARMIEHGGGNAQAIAGEMGFEAMDTSALEAIVDEAIGAQPDAWAKYLAGERKALGAIVGHVMKASKGQADGKLVNEIVAKRAAATADS
jgi:aspartyl-tRNA(Asn)/glutamyl-tRNA(Gln) amidotransferase subunit B